MNRVSLKFLCKPRKVRGHVNVCQRHLFGLCFYWIQINVREYRRGTQTWTIQRNWQHRVHKTKTNKCQRISKGHSQMDNPEKLATQGTQGEDKQMLENIEGTLNNGQSRETGNIGYTRRRKIRLNYNTIGVRRHYT